MTILVNGKEMELKAIGKNGIEWTNDLLGNYDALHYDEERDAYTMTEEEFAWWVGICPRLEKIYERAEKLTEDQKVEYNCLDGCDLEQWVEMAEDFLNNL